ncbi:hypothetical protein AJ80_02741 [Polytolypa hystricis UAMH7299]|uniref:Cytokinesis regulator n=1 Tax=Polytolypa hystricis (strain UAMH7299) TaxID=1447883 RepID=A0A2B7YQ45_POLH7|nr:hypothetical protein AJ80_02741 [Polytolypa hystricis UAMH7299]
MDSSPLRLHHSREELVECWDDDEDLQCMDDSQFRAVSTATSVTGSSTRPSGHRDSISSRRSFRSDIDSNLGDEEDWQLLLNDNDEAATQDAIASAKSAGIPIPENVPKSALIGGAIKRLGGKKTNKAIGDDWSEDLELLGIDGELELKLTQRSSPPESLGTLSSFPSPIESRESLPLSETASPSPPRLKSVVHTLEKFRDTEEDSSFNDVPTIKIAKSRAPPSLAAAFQPPPNKQEEDYEDDLELPTDGEPLRLSTRRDTIKTPDPLLDDFDTEWAEGSIGIRFAGTRRDGFSNRSSTVSALSPSLSSCLTAESEDDILDGLHLPDGPIDFDKALKKKQLPQSPPPRSVAQKQSPKSVSSPPKDDFFSGIEIGEGDVFDSGKLTLNRNIKHKTARPASPARRTATTITFTNKPISSSTRIPRLSGHDRPHSTHLEPVSESGAPVPKYRRPHSRLSGGHATHSSLSNIPLPSPSSHSSTPMTPNRRGGRSSGELVRSEPTTTTSQLLKAKRSVPIMRSNVTPPGTAQHVQRPPSRQDGNGRPLSAGRPKTPVERSTTAAESRYAIIRRPPVPFLPAGASENQSHHVSVKTTRHYRRTDSDSSGDFFMNPRSTSRLSTFNRPETPARPRSDPIPGALLATAKHSVTRPTRRRNFGDGSELDVFDDLPTSASTENKFVKVPIRRGAPRSLRARLSQSHISPPRTETPVPHHMPTSPTRQEFTPRFARDTNASRNAREQRIASMSLHLKDRESGPLAPVNSNWKQPLSRPPTSPTVMRNRRHKGHSNSMSKPHLIKPMGTGVHQPKSVKGMHYNPATYQWDGNENATADFDAAPPSKSPKASPALITNVGATSGVKVYGGMVFDPRRMCWLKAAASQPDKDSVALAPEEEDVLAGLDDLDDKPKKSAAASKGFTLFSDDVPTADSFDDKSGGESSDEWPITEEFDVGPEFIKRQRAEEERWRRKVSKWVRDDRKTLGDGWRWAIRDLVRSESIP